MCNVDLNIRGFDDELLRAIKVKAASEGYPMKQWVTDRLREAVNVHGRDGVHLRGDSEGGAVRQASSVGPKKVKADREPDEVVSRASETPRSQTDSGGMAGSGESDRQGEGISQREIQGVTGDRKAHDLKTCNTYGCLQCKALGKEF